MKSTPHLHRKSRSSALWPWIFGAIVLHVCVYLATGVVDVDSQGDRAELAPVEIQIVSAEQPATATAAEVEAPISSDAFIDESEPLVEDPIESPTHPEPSRIEKQSIVEAGEVEEATETLEEEDGEETESAVQTASLGQPPVAASPPALAGDAVEDYRSMVKRLISKKKRYPFVALQRELEGEVLTHITIEEDGSISQLETSGSAPRILTRSAVRAVESASPFPPPPASPLQVEIALRFQIENSSQ